MRQQRKRGGVASFGLWAAALLGACTQMDGPQVVRSPSAASQQVEVGQGRQAPPPAPAFRVPVRVDGEEFEISGPHRHMNLEVFLVHHAHQKATARPIITLREAMVEKKVRVFETGNVEELAIENLDPNVDVFVQSGDIVRGGKQDRVLQKDLLLSAKAGKVPIASFCVEQGRWSARGAASSSGAPRAESNAGAVMRFDASENSLNTNELKRAVRVAKSQQRVWSEVSKTQSMLSRQLGEPTVGSGSTSLELALSDEAVTKAAAAFEKQLLGITSGKKDIVGFAFAINGKMNSAEIYATNDLFTRLWPKMIKATAMEAVAKKSKKPLAAAAELSVDSVREFLDIARGTEAGGEDVNARVRLLTVDTARKVFTETRDRAAGDRWVHRSYLAK